ncbi:peptide/nickel transport system permease protein [Kibdelosporangium banguiense]|uniref:Peptide/nickel transport system permease protein n=1 Tax=Kibdelosporangium banguiense TaxID=1365924 RepID=A0ABS4TTX9_9PSEU|nr:ABC transporter permease [Kibdelosporangium banguiense]MBP2327862.1 peptide/nickel transport system permease protein [Kibdelosporangium banguiense]
MLNFVIRRLAAGVVLLFVISTLAFFLLYLGSGDIARRILGQSATQEGVAQKAASLGLDRPILVQYGEWLGNAVTGHFGSSWFTGQEVSAAVTSRLSVTLTLVLGATLLSAAVAVALGVLAATRRGWLDRVVQVLSIVGFAIPGFLVALGLVLLLAINLQWFSPTGYVAFTTSPVGWFATATLPILALCLAGIASVTQQVRGAVIDNLARDYVRTLRSRGLPGSRVLFKHVLRNAGGPALAVLAVQFVGMFGGAVIIEQVFAIPGIGQIAVTATGQGDIPLVMGVVVVTATLVVVVNLLIDILQASLNPKVRLS